MGKEKKSNVGTGGDWLADASGKGFWSDLRDKNSEKDLQDLLRNSSSTVKFVTRSGKRERVSHV